MILIQIVGPLCAADGQGGVTLKEEVLRLYHVKLAHRSEIQSVKFNFSY